ncbi:MAG: ABC transporter substrate-binding protein [Gammaproteobacteria bacterium]|nr:MAG: ABC transporter substrate-binding protein [Gammaproteobacteria bacterium]RLA00070.1 MAG: ABC transporter substrate-binding protein [Gammaproteobacteria bacterium]
MRRFWSLFLFVIIFVVALIGLNSQSTIQKSQQATPKRIITLAPSITETAFALDLGDNIVAVTDYCDFPSEVLNLPKVGGFVDPNLEAIVALQPDLVILLANQQRTIKQLQQLNIPTLAVFNTRLSNIKEAIHIIGQYTQHQKQAQQLLADIEQKITIIKEKTNGLARPRVMITMGHSIGSEHMKQVFIAGQNDFYNDLITLAGGQNAYQDNRLNVPSLSIEGIMKINPQVIIDIFPEADDHDADLNNVLQQWKNLDHIDAVKNNRMHIIQEDYATIPGPRIFLLLDQFSRLIHPELDWENVSP